jgi:lipopolysaccharide transport system ATP-binding protein
MSEVVIRVENLSKKYRIGKALQPANRRQRALQALAAPFRYLSSTLREASKDEILWALKDVSFEVKRGEVLGIIGRNGAGKSTLLKILSRITEPTSGRAILDGRVGSLLEVGTGFNPELTGRENIYLSGAILGMKKAEIDRKFDEIVVFSEVERFLDTPVKRYSSGMYVRLAFAVAAHLEPEILLVDEVLAVGDVSFQKKCLGKMDEISSQGRTILFVSHNLGAIRTLCEKGLLLFEGTLAFSGHVNDTIDRYTDIVTNKDHASMAFFFKPDGFPVWIESARLLFDGVQKSSMQTGENMTLEVKFRSEQPVANPSIGILITSTLGEKVLNANNIYQTSKASPEHILSGKIKCNLGMVPLMAGHYFLSIWLGDENHSRHQYLENSLFFEVSARDVWGKSFLPTERISAMWWPTSFECFPD